jgi:hypothetical protein
MIRPSYVLSAIEDLRSAVATGADADVRSAAADLALVMDDRLISPSKWAAAFRYAAKLAGCAGRAPCIPVEDTTIAGWTEGGL